MSRQFSKESYFGCDVNIGGRDSVVEIVRNKPFVLPWAVGYTEEVWRDSAKELPWPLVEWMTEQMEVLPSTPFPLTRLHQVFGNLDFGKVLPWEIAPLLKPAIELPLPDAGITLVAQPIILAKPKETTVFARRKTALAVGNVTSPDPFLVTAMDGRGKSLCDGYQRNRMKEIVSIFWRAIEEAGGNNWTLEKGADFFVSMAEQLNYLIKRQQLITSLPESVFLVLELPWLFKTGRISLAPLNI